jgi:hypothetical protein
MRFLKDLKPAGVRGCTSDGGDPHASGGVMLLASGATAFRTRSLHAADPDHPGLPDRASHFLSSIAGLAW